jgi:hypothetical protein
MEKIDLNILLSKILNIILETTIKFNWKIYNFDEEYQFIIPKDDIENAKILNNICIYYFYTDSHIYEYNFDNNTEYIFILKKSFINNKYLLKINNFEGDYNYTTDEVVLINKYVN